MSGLPLLSEFWTKEGLAAELGLNPRTLDRWEVLGMGPPRTLIGRKILYQRVSVQKWLSAQEHRRHTANEKSRKSDRRGAA
jgi:hypothetical protein